MKSLWICLVWSWRNLFGLLINHWQYPTLPGRSPSCKIFCILLDVSVASKIRSCDPIEIDDGLIFGMLLHLAGIIKSACKAYHSGQPSQCSPVFQHFLFFYYMCPPISVKAGAIVKYFLTFIITVLLSEVLECKKCNLHCLTVPAKLRLSMNYPSTMNTLSSIENCGLFPDIFTNNCSDILHIRIRWTAWRLKNDYKMVLEPNVSPHKQIIKNDDVKECISIK